MNKAESFLMGVLTVLVIAGAAAGLNSCVDKPAFKAGDCVYPGRHPERWEKDRATAEVLEVGSHAYRITLSPGNTGRWAFRYEQNLEFFDQRFYTKVPCPQEGGAR